MSKKVILVWFRNDLRTHDNEVLQSAIQKADFIIPVYIFDPRYYQENKFGFKNTGEFRADYIAQTVFSLKQKLQSLGGDLLTYEGYPEQIIPQLVQKYDADEVYHHREVAKRETDISELVEEELWKVKRNLRHFIGHTLYHKEDLPFPIRDIPNDFNTFRKKVAKESFVRGCIADIKQVDIPPHLEKTTFPFDFSVTTAHFGESAANAKLNELIKETEINMESYTELSPYLALGVLSPAYTYHFLKKNITPKNKKGINAFLENLMVRDYFRFMLKKYPNCYFINTQQRSDSNSLAVWTSGQTSCETVNNLMSKLNTTGRLTRTERETVALHLIYELNENWLAGAAWFEQQLIDYAPATIYGFWAHMADQGTSIKNNKSIGDWDKVKTEHPKLVI
ncbi:deoxyribodipyrimidine photo-lyase [Sphingobacterium yanglingense]|uniref:Deoxyribodipyrimidine photo-lyase n=1 Tax=Sphingobacterium yanglingense TaxID=1437280 RepID=A0A4R6WMB0_9SPHI|nr:deoxyribodipyrimidine photo-lyase [Sphingobacterium yanglingense]TDQ77171.1 deoxyribodipyrimidine photo-lyase [Sphingobacterium yanglingense]